ncbi:MAG TPA: carbamoyltransferase HypF [Candidatus Binatia bacterium]|nr:carbamoyltransferase HypF [Candidatus Binatia bacterium]
MSTEGRRIEVSGVVQGVGFRPWVYRIAREAGLSGRVRNDAAGVAIDVFGSGEALDGFVERLATSPPPGAAIQRLASTAIAAEPGDDFQIVASEAGSARHLSIPPDRATCGDCLAEIVDARDRRYRHPFTNCTRCGPRFTIARDVPYDRATTTMAGFTMCTDCEREYRSVTDRRFHAEPNACPACGPRLRLLAYNGTDLAPRDPLRLAVSALRSGLIVAIKGIGGFHLACDVASPGLSALRTFKRRDEKPFAVMVRDLAAAERLAELTDAERQLLTSVERPIVLARRRPEAHVPDGVAPGSPLIGLLLPYSPLHHLLLADLDGPLVMTSGNAGGEPIAHRDPDAIARLEPIADAFLAHDRAIESPCDDSVARVIAGSPVVLRRARGWTPRAFPIRTVTRPVLACGAQLKNTFCLAVGDRAYLSAHVGDLDDAGTLESFEQAIGRMERWLDVHPEVVAHDLHPGYVSTAYARARPAAERIAVQHHHAHVASAMAEHGLEGPVLGIAYDGTGWGTDGTAWGGELLLADVRGFERLATFRPLPLPGGDTAIREVWRIALGLLDDAFDHETPLEGIALFSGVPSDSVRIVRRMIASGLNVSRARGVGRYFDAVGALALARRESHHEGQVALALELVADPDERASYPFAIDEDTTPREIDLRPLVRALFTDLLAGTAPACIAAKFHNTVVTATAECVRAAARRVGRLPVVLTGGCFQNARLAEGVVAALTPDLALHLHRDVPPGDGGIALGQALIAAAVASERAA